MDVLRVLLDAGEDPGRYNPDGFHSHAAPLDWAEYLGQREAAAILRDARTRS